jgi:hypothetical protein
VFTREDLRRSAGSIASLAANVAVTEPIPTGRIVAAWSSVVLTASFEFAKPSGAPRRFSW